MKSLLMIAAAALLLCGGAGRAAASPDQACAKARLTAWATYQACIDKALARDYSGLTATTDVAMAKCRKTYFATWAKYQTNGSLNPSVCVGPRLVDNGATVTDNLTNLTWEKKTGTLGGGSDSNPENVNNGYNWGTWGVGSGAAYTIFVPTVNAEALGGANDWRLPTIAELQTTLLPFTCSASSCTCPSTPCIDATFGVTQVFQYWSATSYLDGSSAVWALNYFPDSAYVRSYDGHTFTLHVRAVRGGL